MRLFDLHCDTLTELFDRGETIERSTCHIRKEYIDGFEKYGQVFAVFSKVGLDDEGCYKRFFEIADKFCEFLQEEDHILSVEDGRLLAGDISRLEALYGAGVRILTPLWGGVTCIGGAFDTDEGLTPFGNNVIRECHRLGIIPDISHASKKSTAQILDITESEGKTAIASHSNAWGVCHHERNLRDEDALMIKDLGGVVGISLYPPHLCKGVASSESVLSHIEYYLTLMGEDSVCMGADLDGIDVTPVDITCLSDMENLYNTLLRHNYSEALVNKLFYDNASKFIGKYFK